ncbi:hypothetical protein [uncultured Bacteroides sp.]|uniref:hypothetical protein n=1 Tax=uncultured Bacteroides sp. TaxID=162156 RepID=UPI0025E081AF|nr:hypothetical protein [uncultured Bacteroides sp.]
MEYSMKLFGQQVSALATVLPMSCQGFGKLLPSGWQDFATALAKLCHCIGKMLAK